MIRILPPPAANGQGSGRRLLHAVPDLGLGSLFGLAWLDRFGLGVEYGESLMLLIEIEGWILIITFLATILAYGLATESDPRERLKALVLLVLACTIPPLVFALRWDLWWPVGVYAGLLANRLRLARAGASGAQRLRTPMRELLLYGGAALVSMLVAVPDFAVQAAWFDSANYPGWCHAPEYVIPDRVLRDMPVVTWCAEPHRALMAGSVYYVVTGLFILISGPYRLSLLSGRVRRDADE